MKTKEKRATQIAKPKLHRTAMYWLNPKTHFLVCYQRASQLHLINKEGVKYGFKNPKTNRLITPKRAVVLGLVEV